MQEWVEIGTYNTKEAAHASLEKLKKEHQVRGGYLHDEDIRIDVIRSKEKNTIFRCRVRRFALME